ncbi:hypothetical protein SHELI_v1c01820 [Spiroplasma helicoides]|uniref:Uncharacterized protein n=1 Tax=Spiroplasma helicoides TaxID=216938 RepID=A0A1B3SJN3_9MOLU|nr:hypothetical protein [Spiroplasma helicoides]AOG60137.1 hypothetical protein SHELI_v1c01820 [Spiroplasma helicoides]
MNKARLTTKIGLILTGFFPIIMIVAIIFCIVFLGSSYFEALGSFAYLSIIFNIFALAMCIVSYFLIKSEKLLTYGFFVSLFTGCFLFIWGLTSTIILLGYNDILPDSFGILGSPFQITIIVGSIIGITKKPWK